MATPSPTPAKGYPEANPATPDEARKPDPNTPRNPEEGGMDREPDPEPPGKG